MTWPVMTRRNAMAQFAIIFAVAIPAAIAIGSYHPARLEDDFYYYFVVMKNFVTRGYLTFDGINPTNGFHPLWFVILSLVYEMTGQADGATLRLAHGTACLLPLIGAVKVDSFLRHSRPQASRLGVAAAAILYGVTSLLLSASGMEVAVTLALFPWLLARQADGLRCPRDALTFSLLASLVVLSRLDSVLIVGPIWAYAMGQYYAGQRGNLGTWTARNMPWAIAGGLPFIAYELANLHYFGGLLPQSSTAKSLSAAAGPFPEALRIFTHMRTGIALTALYVGCLVLWSRGLFAPKKAGVLPFAVVVWPIVFYGILLFRSPWQLWVWYLYPLVACLPAAFVILDGIPSWRRLGATAVVVASAVYLMAVTTAMAKRAAFDPSRLSYFAAAQHLQDFAATHPGVYAMGDRAGMVGYLIGRPVIQLEGLVGGAKVIEAIRGQEDLLTFLRDNAVDYYIGTDLTTTADGCYHAIEPRQGGPEARHMQTQLCAEPVTQFAITPLPFEGSDQPAIHTQVFKLPPR